MVQQLTSRLLGQLPPDSLRLLCPVYSRCRSFRLCRRPGNRPSSALAHVNRALPDEHHRELLPVAGVKIFRQGPEHSRPVEALIACSPCQASGEPGNGVTTRLSLSSIAYRRTDLRFSQRITLDNLAPDAASRRRREGTGALNHERGGLDQVPLTNSTRLHLVS